MGAPTPHLLRIAPQALVQIGLYLSEVDARSVALLWGDKLIDIVGDTVYGSLKKYDQIIAYQKVVTTNSVDDAFDVAKELPQEVTTVVAIGGGTAIDFGKYVAFQQNLTLIAVPTLISNDAFASSQSSLLVDGKRRSIQTVLAQGIIIDTTVIQASDKRYIYSGIGEILCKTTALFDWNLAAEKDDESIDDFAVSITRNALDTFRFYHPKDFQSLEYIEVIARALLMTGMAMTVARSSRPASGAEHLISHAYDTLSTTTGLHGIQVGVASYGCAFLQETPFQQVRDDMVKSGFFDYVAEHPLDKELFVEAVRQAPHIKKNYTTILSQPEMVERLIHFISTDTLMQQMVQG